MPWFFIPSCRNTYLCFQKRHHIFRNLGSNLVKCFILLSLTLRGRFTASCGPGNSGKSNEVLGNSLFFLDKLIVHGYDAVCEVFRSLDAIRLVFSTWEFNMGVQGQSCQGVVSIEK